MRKLTKRVVALVIACVLTAMSMPISVQAACQHPSQKVDGNGNLVYVPTGPASHHAVCSVCELTYGNGELHVDNDNNQSCDACAAAVNCLHQNAGRWWDTDEKEHTLYCICGYPVQPTVVHTDTVKNSDKSAGSDSLCDDCNVYVQYENGELVHKHTTTTQWFSNIANTEHFNKCTDNECTRLFNTHTAIDADDDGECDVCNYSMTNGGQGSGQGSGQGGPANQPRFDWSFSIGGFKVPIGGTFTIGVLDGNRPAGSTVDVLLGYVDANDDFVPYAAADQKGIAIVYDNNGVPTSVTFDGAVIYANNPLAMNHGYFHVAVVVKDAKGDILASNGCDVWLAGYNGGQAGSCTHNGFQWYGTDGAFHELYCGQCGESISNIENHDDADGDTKCDVCGVGVVNNVHNHVWSTQWSSSSMHHFYDCTDSACTTSTGAEVHDDSADNDGLCDKCGYGTPSNPGGGNQSGCPHNFVWYSIDETVHRMNCNDCNSSFSRDPHVDIYDNNTHNQVADGLCDICDARVSYDANDGEYKHAHNFNPNWDTNSNGHYHECLDGACTSAVGFANHEDKVDNANTSINTPDGFCDDCGYTMCTHSNNRIDGYEIGPEGHKPLCYDCGNPMIPANQKPEYHRDTDGNDRCDVCDATLELVNGSLEHTHKPGLWVDNGAGHSAPCNGCTYIVFKEGHVNRDGDGVCDLCQANVGGGNPGPGPGQSCSHNNFWMQVEKYTHQTMCGFCGDPCGSQDPHIDGDDNSLCDECWAPVVDENGDLVHNHNRHPHGWFGGTDTHFYKCDTCGMSIFQIEPHIDADHDSICDVCKVSLDANLEHYCTSSMLGFMGQDEYWHVLYCTECYREYQQMQHVDVDNDDFCDDCQVTLDSDDIHVHQTNGTWTEVGIHEHCSKCTECDGWAYESHSDNDGDNYCDICNGDLSCKHDGFQWYGTDREIHELHCGMCGESISNMEYHNDADGDTKCDVCGVGVVNNIHTHVWSTVWESNDTGHWHPCVDSACTTSLSSFAHEDADNDGSCDECGDTDTYRWCKNHWHNGDYAHSDDYHYTMCGDCWNAYGAGIAHYGADGYRVEADKHYPVCVDCWMSYGPGVAHADTDNDGCCDECDTSMGVGVAVINGIYYTAFDDALDAANVNGGTIVLLKDYAHSSKRNPQITSHVIIDSNGYQFSVSDDRFGQLIVEAGASLTLTGNGKLVGGAHTIPILVKEGGALIVEEEFHMDMPYTSDVENYGTVIYKGSGKTIYNVGDGVAHIYGSIGSIVNDGGIVHIYEGADISGRQFPIANNLKGTVNIYGGTIDGSCEITASSGVINIYGGTILCPLQISLDNTNYANDPQIGSYEVSGGSFPNGLEVITSTSISTQITLEDILAKDYCYYLDGVPVILASGQTTITGGDVTVGKIPAAPSITKQPADVEVKLGERFSISPQVQGSGLTYQWYYKDSYMKDFAVSSNKTSAYAYSMQSYMHNRQVYCVITDQYGNQVTTDVATITRPAVELKLLAQPVDACSPIGQKFSVSPQVQGDGLTYQWYYKDSYMKDFAVSSNKTSAYAYSMQSYMHNRQVYCVITDQYGNQVTTDVATITRPAVELKILAQSTGVATYAGKQFCISFQVQGDGLTYQWYYKDSYMKDFAVSSNKTSAYAYSMQSYMNNRQVYCVITDQYGNQVTTEVATIYLLK